VVDLAESNGIIRRDVARRLKRTIRRCTADGVFLHARRQGGRKVVVPAKYARALIRIFRILFGTDCRYYYFSPRDSRPFICFPPPQFVHAFTELAVESFLLNRSLTHIYIYILPALSSAPLYCCRDSNNSVLFSPAIYPERYLSRNARREIPLFLYFHHVPRRFMAGDSSRPVVHRPFSYNGSVVGEYSAAAVVGWLWIFPTLTL